MIEITNIFDVEKYIENYDVFIFDLDDTLYSETDYIKSGFKAVSEEKFDELWAAFENKENAFDKVMSDQKEKALQIYRNHFPSIKLYDGVLSLFDKLQKAGKQLGLITDGRPEGQRSKIKALGIEPYFKKIIISDELGGVEFRKPNSKAFEIMKEFFNMDYSKMVYVGDNLKKDFIAPTKLGMGAIHFKNKDGLYN